MLIPNLLKTLLLGGINIYIYIYILTEKIFTIRKFSFSKASSFDMT